MNGFYALGTTAVVSSAAPLGTGIFTFRRLSADMRLLVLLFLLTTLVEGITFYQALTGVNSHWLHFIYTPISYGLLVYVFSGWQANDKVKWGSLASIPIFLAICVWNIVIQHRLDTINDFTQSLANVILVLFASYTFLWLLAEDLGSIYRDYRFWISAAVLIYSAGSLGYFVMHNIISSERIVVAWYFHIVLNILANLTYSVGLLCQYRRA